MLAKVVDASAVGAILFDEKEAERMAEALEGCELLAPSLLSYEVFNICLKKCRGEPSRQEQLLSRMNDLPALAISEIQVDHGEVVKLAASHQLTHYDASYLWLARHMGAPLVTLDRALIRAASA